MARDSVRFIDLKRQYAKQKEAINKAIGRVLEHGQFILGPEVHKLEEHLAAFVGVRHCVTVANGTDSLQIALMALDIQPDDEVITVPFTFISTAHAIRLRGARPVFVDIHPDDYMMDPDQLQAAITPRTKAIIPVSLYGQMPQLERIQEIADRYSLAVIEDGAQSFGATRHGIRSCGASLIGSTSFFPTKPLGGYGDGGALFTNDDHIADRMRVIRTHGGRERDDYERLGFNSRLDTIQAAILLTKFSRFHEELEARERVARRYTELLAGIVQTPTICEGNTHVFAQYTIRCPDRSGRIASLREHQIPYGIYYPRCLHLQSAFAFLKDGIGCFPVAEKAAQEVLSLPMHAWLTEAEQDQVVAAVRHGAAVLVGEGMSC